MGDSDPLGPYDSSNNYDYFGIMNDSNPTLANLSSTNDPAASFNPFGGPITNVPPFLFNDPMAWNHIYNRPSNTTTQQSHEAGPSPAYNGREAGNDQPTLLDNRQPFRFWPSEASLFHNTTTHQSHEAGPSSTYNGREAGNDQPTFLDDRQPFQFRPSDASLFHNTTPHQSHEAGPSSSTYNGREAGNDQPTFLDNGQRFRFWPSEASLFHNTTTHQSHEAGPSSTHGGREAGNDQPTFLDDSQPLPLWPPEAAPYQCSCCQVLREIIHSDVAGKCATKLEIHGRLGIICHAILEIKDRVSMVPSASQFRMIDFCKKSIENVKEYLQQYCDDQSRAGLVLVQDPLSIFYEALCVGIGNLWEENATSEEPSDSEVRPAPRNRERASRNLAEQRQRAARMNLRDLKDYFDIPINQASRQLNLCPTVVKKICRRNGMSRWPYRKIKCNQRKISEFTAILNANESTAAERTIAAKNIRKLEAEISKFYAAGNN
ncbi:uncharacterized protein [Euphorbia lathyris]|uniref:uncharacterized protein isoform X2 n=1 Tax=Euphorbia lathyris TaxID=212925 RepID=UPI0033144E19